MRGIRSSARNHKSTHSDDNIKIQGGLRLFFGAGEIADVTHINRGERGAWGLFVCV